MLRPAGSRRRRPLVSARSAGPERRSLAVRAAPAGPGEIWVNASEARRWPTRRRFTIGHELGHYCLHHSQGAAVWCRTGCLEHEARPTALPPLPPEEEEANAFAAALLMPARLVRAHYRSGMDFFAFCDRFGASGSAMGKRLHAVI